MEKMEVYGAFIERWYLENGDAQHVRSTDMVFVEAPSRRVAKVGMAAVYQAHPWKWIADRTDARHPSDLIVIRDLKTLDELIDSEVVHRRRINAIKANARHYANEIGIKRNGNAINGDTVRKR